MSIINDALKKTQLNLKKPKRNLKDQDNQNQPNNPSVTNVYEKLYKAREEQRNLSVSQIAQGKEASLKTATPRQTKKWIKTTLVGIFFISAILGSFYLLRSYLPLEGFFNSAKQKSSSSRFRVSQPAPAKRKHKSGELILNGISFINGRNVALINDEIYEVGETVDGKKITRIGLDSVELRDDQKIFTIKVR